MRRARGRLLSSAIGMLLLVSASACDGDGTGIGQPTRISITPSEPVALYIGDTLTVRAIIRNTPHTDVSYSSSAPEIVSVDAESGLATAVAPGEATIIGVSTIDPRIFAEARLTVLPDLPATLSLAELRAADGSELDPSRVSGTIEVALELVPGNARRLEVQLGERLVCERQFESVAEEPPPPLAVECVVDTAAFEEVTAEPHFMNGEAVLSARLVASGERTLARVADRPLTLANPARILASVTATESAVDAAGGAWVSGDVTVVAVPVLYEPGTAVKVVTMEYRSPGGADTSATANSGPPFTFTLPMLGVLREVTDPAFRVSLTGGGEGEEPGPEAVTDALRYDATPPRPGVLMAREWIGAQTRFVDTYSTEGETDAGVGRVHLRFHAGDPALSPEAIVAAGRPVVVGADLAQAPLGSYRLVAEVCDGLENCTLLDGYDFGVDLTPPLVESVGIPDRTANPGSDLLVGLRDDLSGFPAQMLEVTVRLLDAAPGTAACGPLVEGIDLPGSPTGAGCVPDTIGNPVPVPRTTAGYYDYAVVAFDRAGNRSASVARSLLVDLEPPSIGPITISSPLVAGEEMSVAADLDDDVELHSVAFRLVYPEPDGAGSIAAPFAPATQLGVPFDPVLSTEASATGTLPFVRTLTLGSATSGSRPTLLVDSVRATARDVAGLTATSRRAITPAEYGGDTSTADPFSRYSTAHVTVDRTAVCSGGCQDGDPVSLRISARIEGESGTGRPFARIHFLLRHAAGSLMHIGSVDGSDATITNVGNRSTYVYVFDYEPAGGVTGDYGVTAIGVNSRGNALSTALAGAPKVTFYHR